MKEFGVSPDVWSSMPQRDKDLLHYHRVMESHYLAQINEKHERDRKRIEQKQNFLKSLPQQQVQRGR